jgi:hypothetical protein
MSDVDAELGAAFDAATGTKSVIEVGAQVQPDTKPRPGQEWRPEIDNESASLDDAISATIAKAGEKAYDPERIFADELKDPPMPEGFTGGIEDSANKTETELRRSEVWKRIPLSARQQIHKLRPQIAEMMQVGLAMGLSEQAAQQLAIQQIWQKKSDAESTEPSALHRAIVPDAKTAAEAEERASEVIRPYQDFEADYAQSGAAAFVKAAHARGHTNIMDADDPVASLHLAMRWYGKPLGPILEGMGYVPRENVEQLQQQAVRAVFDEIASSILNSPELAEHEGRIAELLKGKLAGESNPIVALTKAAEMVQREVARKPRKAAWERTIAAKANEIYSREGMTA